MCLATARCGVAHLQGQLTPPPPPPSPLPSVVATALLQQDVPYAVVSHSMGCYCAYEFLQLARSKRGWCRSRGACSYPTTTAAPSALPLMAVAFPLLPPRP